MSKDKTGHFLAKNCQKEPNNLTRAKDRQQHIVSMKSTFFGAKNAEYENFRPFPVLSMFHCNMQMWFEFMPKMPTKSHYNY